MPSLQIFKAAPFGADNSPIAELRDLDVAIFAPPHPLHAN
ncbi:Hypothetical protein (plasmid) [Pseudomonas putida]|nr:Hypothetical protein [Pseudomonas putida]